MRPDNTPRPFAPEHGERIEKAPAVEAQPFNFNGDTESYPYAAIALTGELAKQLGGNRVRLVVEEE